MSRPAGSALFGPALMALLALPVLLVLGGCSLWGPEGGPGGAGIAGTAAPTGAPATASDGADGVQRIEIVVGDDLRFQPARVHAHPGVIELTFRNAGQTPHDVRPAVTPPAGTGNLNGGETSRVRITVDRPGTYPFPCVYHETSGMVGVLEVG